MRIPSKFCVLLLSLALLGGCSQGDEPACAHAPDGPFCSGNTLITCDETGAALDQPCDPDRCAFDAPVPQCVPADALPCEPDTTPDECRDGKLYHCDESSGYEALLACEAGSLCVGVGGECELLAKISCRETSWSPLCVEGDKYVCEQGRVAVEARGCR